jgi:hypothetical protein
MLGNITDLSDGDETETEGPGISILPSEGITCVVDPDQEDSMLISIPQKNGLLSQGRIIHPPLLPERVASMISSVSMASRVSLRLVSIAVERLFDSFKFSAAATLGVSRRALVSAVSSARTLHQLTVGKPEGAELQPFYKVLDAYTNNGIYAIHTAFSLAEMLCLTTFHLYSATIRFTLEMAEESVHIFDGLFGETDTSKALAAFICIFIQELQGQDDALGLTQRFGKIYALGQMAKAMTAYCCLQYLNKKRWRSLVKLHPVFEGRILKKKGSYDPAAKVATKDMFKSADPLHSPDIPKLLRRASIEMLQSYQRSYPSSPIHGSKSYEDLLDVRPRQRRARFNSEGKIDKLNNSIPLEQLAPPKQNVVPRIEVTNPRYHIEKAARYVQFAVGAYGSHFLKIMGIEKPRQTRFSDLDEHHNHYSLANHTDIPVENIINSSYDALSTLHAPKLIAPVHYVVIDPATESVVVSLRGTLGLSDIVTDLVASYEHYVYSDDMDGYVHSGMLYSAKVLSSGAIRDIVADALYKNPTYSLVLTGHSLGGGCAALLTMLWSKRVVLPDGTHEFYTDTAKGFPMRKIHSYIFACPAIMSADLSRFFKGLITTFIYRNDVVPCLSLGLIRDFRNITISLCNEQGMAEGVIGKVLGVFQQPVPESEKDDLWYWALLKTLRADMKAEKLYPPGLVYWINANPHGYTQDRPVEPSKLPKSGDHDTTLLSIAEVDDVEIAFSEIVFSTSMFTDQYILLNSALLITMKDPLNC